MLWKITADELMSWANSRVSQGDLPELIRRLIHSTIPSSKILSHCFSGRQFHRTPELGRSFRNFGRQRLGS